MDPNHTGDLIIADVVLIVILLTKKYDFNVLLNSFNPLMVGIFRGILFQDLAAEIAIKEFFIKFGIRYTVFVAAHYLRNVNFD